MKKKRAVFIRMFDGDGEYSLVLADKSKLEENSDPAEILEELGPDELAIEGDAKTFVRHSAQILDGVDMAKKAEELGWTIDYEDYFVNA